MGWVMNLQSQRLKCQLKRLKFPCRVVIVTCNSIFSMHFFRFHLGVDVSVLTGSEHRSGDEATQARGYGKVPDAKKHRKG